MSPLQRLGPLGAVVALNSARDAQLEAYKRWRLAEPGTKARRRKDYERATSWLLTVYWLLAVETMLTERSDI